jgi:hypothetical protein
VARQLAFEDLKEAFQGKGVLNDILAHLLNSKWEPANSLYELLC